MRNLLATCSLIACTATTALAQDAAAGKRAFSHCGNCHQVGPTARSIAAPALNGLFGRAAGSLVDYDYSEAIKGSGLIWDEDTFSRFIKDPQATIPGTKMFFHGIQDEQRIRDIIAYLQQFQ